MTKESEKRDRMNKRERKMCEEKKREENRKERKAKDSILFDKQKKKKRRKTVDGLAVVGTVNSVSYYPF